MLNNALIIFPTQETTRETCDFLYQTAGVLAKQNTVVVVQLRHAQSFMQAIKHHFRGMPHRLWKRGKKVWYFRPLYLLPFRRFERIERWNIFITMLALQFFFFCKNAFRPFSKKIVWLFFPKLTYTLSSFRTNWHVIFDAVDWYIPTPPDTVQLLRRADTITSISHTLAKAYQGLLNRKIDIVPQGFRVPRRSHNLVSKKPSSATLGFIGGISNRLDWPLLESLAKRHPDWRFVLAGPIEEDPNIPSSGVSRARKFIQRANVFYKGVVPHEQTPQRIRQFDIGIIPYDTAWEFNRRCYPMKLFEYFYEGKPVLATPIAELKRFPHYVKIGARAAEWEQHIAQLLRAPWPLNKQKTQRQLAINNSWEQKIEAISRAVQSQTV